MRAALAISGNAHRFVILGRSKERSDAAQTPGSMPRLQSSAAVQILLCCTLRLRLWHGSQGLRDGASLLLRPGMTKLGRLRPIPDVYDCPSKRTMRSWLPTSLQRVIFLVQRYWRRLP
ncbi:hypothetical protein EJ066_22345 [Mesorhizobium sp. M9A.F.Ca.ET.002.03.1.2]|nr:hypothetical protein EJ066_22345 [Mesorhizobium sp. M9A.F.Ca.ET.002.03.1.2]